VKTVLVYYLSNIAEYLENQAYPGMTQYIAYYLIDVIDESILLLIQGDK